MIHGIGTDILNIQTIAPSVADRSDPFVRKTYTEKELELIDSCLLYTSPSPRDCS